MIGNNSIISINLGNDILLKLDAKAKKEGKNRSELVNELLDAILCDSQYFFLIKRRQAELEFIKYNSLLKKVKK